MAQLTPGLSENQGRTFEITKSRSLWGDAARTFARNKAGLLGLALVAIVLLIAILAPWIAPYDYIEQDWEHVLEPPSSLHLMGTDAVKPATGLVFTYVVYIPHTNYAGQRNGQLVGSEYTSLGK